MICRQPGFLKAPGLLLRIFIGHLALLCLASCTRSTVEMLVSPLSAVNDQMYDGRMQKRKEAYSISRELMLSGCRDDLPETLVVRTVGRNPSFYYAHDDVLDVSRAGLTRFKLGKVRSGYVSGYRDSDAGYLVSWARKGIYSNEEVQYYELRLTVTDRGGTIFGISRQFERAERGGWRNYFNCALVLDPQDRTAYHSSDPDTRLLYELVEQDVGQSRLADANGRPFTEAQVRERLEQASRPQMVPIPAGSIQMGSDEEVDEKPIHTVSVPAFHLAKTEVTQAQWRAVMGNTQRVYSSCDDCPIQYVGWNDIQRYLKKLNANTGKQYRLPSEAEWEYACRAGGNHTYCGSDNIDEVAWTGKNSGLSARPVGQKHANAFGLHDMSGNVWEWVQDCWNDTYAGAPTNGSPWFGGDCGRRVMRGGSWSSSPRNTRSANRFMNASGYRSDDIGFRVALSSATTN